MSTFPRSGAATPRIGFIPPSGIERAFVILLYIVMVVLALLSVFGTFYGIAGDQFPLVRPLRVIADVIATPAAFGIAFVVQTTLTLAQYGARQMARYDRRWWLAYLAALGISVYYNLQAYYGPVTDLGVPWLIAVIVIIAGDVLPEFLAVRHD